MELNIDWLIENELTPNEFYFLISLKKGKEEVWKFLLDLNCISTVDLESMLKNGYLLDPRRYDKLEKDRERIESMEVSQKFIDLISVNTNQLYAEFCSNFPIKVPGRTTGSYRYLHVKGAAVEKKYNDIIQSKLAVHKQIIEGLQKELEVRKQANSMAFMHNMETWLNRRVWETYLEKEKEVKSGSKKFKLAE